MKGKVKCKMQGGTPVHTVRVRHWGHVHTGTPNIDLGPPPPRFPLMPALLTDSIGHQPKQTPSHPSPQSYPRVRPRNSEALNLSP